MKDQSGKLQSENLEDGLFIKALKGKMTNEQKNAERIAEFLGLEKKECEFADHGSYRNGKQGINFRKAVAYVTSPAEENRHEMVSELDRLPQWLASNDGTVAMIKKLNLTHEGRSFLYLILACTNRSEENLNNLLQGAILELLEVK